MSDTPIFNEDKLQAEIHSKWGAHGAHAEVYAMLLAKLARKTALLREAVVRIQAGPTLKTLACLKCNTSIGGFTIQGSDVRCHTCGHSWNTYVVDPLVDRIEKELK